MTDVNCDVMLPVILVLIVASKISRPYFRFLRINFFASVCGLQVLVVRSTGKNYTGQLSVLSP